jgi:hypothetical protein
LLFAREVLIIRSTFPFSVDEVTGMEMVLLDWTRMGKSYCLAGAVAERDGWKMVRPLLARQRQAPVRKVGWSPFRLERHSRWEVFQLIGPEPAAPVPPHLEDTWVRNLVSCRRLAPRPQRRAILEAGTKPDGDPLFGVHLCGTRTAAYLKSGAGERSLATLVVESRQICFHGTQRLGAPEADFRVTLDMPGLTNRSLPLKDHFLLVRAEQAGADLGTQLKELTRAVRQMGDTVAVRVGLSRGFDPADQEAQDGSHCWLMADGFFSLDDPQP